MDGSHTTQSAGSTVSGMSNESVADINALHQDAHVQQQVLLQLLELNEIATSGIPHKLKS